MARTLSKGEKPLDWVGSSKRELLGFPEPVKDEMGDALGLAQFGGKHPSAKPWKGQDPGIFELLDDHDGNSYRAAYVLHAFQKRSPKGIRTARVDVDLVERRLKIAQRDYEVRHGKAKR